MNHAQQRSRSHAAAPAVARHVGGTRAGLAGGQVERNAAQWRREERRAAACFARFQCRGLVAAGGLALGSRNLLLAVPAPEGKASQRQRRRTHRHAHSNAGNGACADAAAAVAAAASLAGLAGGGSVAREGARAGI